MSEQTIQPEQDPPAGVEEELRAHDVDDRLADQLAEQVRRGVWMRDARALLDHIEAHPELTPSASLDCWAWGHDRDTFARLTRALGRGLKKDNAGSLTVEREFGVHRIRVAAFHELVCERVVVGTEIVLVADPDAPQIAQARDVVEWRCPPVLLGDSQ